MNVVVGIIVGLLALMALVTLHEFGHFLMARKNGVKVLEFGIGFPPKAVAWVKDPKTHKWQKLPRSEWGKPQKGLIFSLNWLPIGGFCQMDGESASDTREGTFGKASFWAKTKILFGGVMMNWLTAWVIFTLLAWVGMPQFVEGQFTIDSDTRVVSAPVEVIEVAAESPAEKAGILPGDLIVAVDGNEFTHAYEITDYNAAHAGETVNYTVTREDGEIETAVTLNSAEAEYLLGVTMETTQTLAYSTWSAPIVGLGITGQLTGMTFQGVGELIGNLFSGVGSLFSFDAEVRENGQAALSSVGDSVSGPVGIIGQLFPAFTASGINNLLFLAALISVSLACMNVLPIPALDGGRWLLIGWYKLRKKPLTKETEEKIVSRAMMVLLALIFIVTILDITRFFR